MTTCMILNDGMAVLRARLEIDRNRFSISNLLHEIDSSPHLHFWIFDGPHNTRSRQQIFPEYKAKRKPARQDIYQGIQFIKNLLKLTKAIVIEVPNFEADDVIAAMCRKYGGVMPIVINSRDYDLRALCSRPLNIDATVGAKDHVKDCDITLYKTLVGDTSDNIPGVYGFGDGSWNDSTPAKLQKVLDAVLENRPLPFAEDCGMKQAHLNWIEENRPRLKAMYRVVCFQDLDQETIDSNTIVGVSDLKARTEALREFA